MTVSSQDTVFQYVGNGVTTTFAYSCQVPTATDLRVFLNDVEQFSGFSITGLGSLTGGTVIFSAPPASLIPIRIERDIELERSTDYQQNGDFLSDVVNPDFDRIWMALQQHLSGLKRAIKVPKSDTVAPIDLPPAAQRANFLLSFDASGQPTVVAPSAQSASALAILLASPSGASYVGFIQNALAAQARTLEEKARERGVSALDFMTPAQRADVQGGFAAIDVTAVIQAALNASKNIVIPPGKYLINPVDPNYPTTKYGGGLKPQNGSTIVYDAGAQFVMAPTNRDEYVVWNLRGTTDVTIIRGDVVGDVGSHTGATGEWGFGYYVASAVNPRIIDCRASKFWGDGIIFDRSIETSSAPVSGGVLQNFWSDNNRRQGMSISSWVKGMVLGGEFNNTGQIATTQPSYGIDIEPNPDGVCQIDVMMIGVRTSGNKFGGIQFVPGFMSNNLFTRPTYNVTVIGWESNADGDNGPLRFAYPDLTNPGVNVANRVYGQITVDRPRIINATKRAIDFARWVPTAPRVVINAPYIENPNTSGSVATNEDQCGIVFFLDVANIANQTSTGTVDINNPVIVDTRAVPKLLVPIWGQTGAGQSIDNVTIRNPSGSGWTSSANGFTRFTNASGTGNAVLYDNPPKIDRAGTETLVNGAFEGYSYAVTADSVTTLESAATCVGRERIFDNRFAATWTIRPAAGDTILMFGRVVSGDIVMRLRGTRMKLKSLGSTFWEVVEAQGNIVQGGMEQARDIFFKSSMPTTGSFTQGTWVINTTPAAGVTPAWVRLTTGSGNVLNTDWRAMPVL